MDSRNSAKPIGSASSATTGPLSSGLASFSGVSFMKSARTTPDDALAPRRPGLVVAGGGRALAAGECRARRAVGRGRAGHVRHMRLFPLVRLVAGLGRRRVGGVMHPAVPARRDAARLGKSVVDHP